VDNNTLAAEMATTTASSAALLWSVAELCAAHATDDAILIDQVIRASPIATARSEILI
jgi:hypothetical protein